jgi:hypothetical protein
MIAYGQLFLRCVTALILYASVATSSSTTVPDARPPTEKRTFTSSSIEALISTLQPLWKTGNIAQLFANTLPNTLDTTIFANDGSKDTFVITGDIPAMWLRDSSNQLISYIPYVDNDPALEDLIVGAINRQAASIILDPYANAFNFNASTASGQDHQSDDRKPKMAPAVFEGKYELDSLASFLKLSYWYFRYAQGGASRFAAKVDVATWAKAVGRALDVIEAMQRVTGQESKHASPYLFQRETSVATDTLSMEGRGPPGNADHLGLSRQLFRPSDDAVSLPYNVPGNAFACVELTHAEVLLDALGSAQGELKNRVSATKARLCAAVQALVADAKGGVLAYEIDGYGSALFMDDANAPSLLSLPLLGALSSSDPTYRTTRSHVWSARNPFFYSGIAGEGIGGPHVGPNMAWPMSLTIRALTSSDEGEIAACLDTILRSTAGTGLVHESFDVNDVNHYTRPWFAWANGLYAELLLQLVHAHPTLVLKDHAEAIKAAQGAVKVPVSLQVMRDGPVLGGR